MTEKKSMADIWKQMERQHGSEGLFAGSSDGFAMTEVISTGSYGIDDALDVGGIPRGHVVQFAGFESSGKTMLSLLTIAEWQKKAPQNWAMFIDAEYSYDRDWAASLGCDTDRIMVYKENNGTKIFERLVGQSSKTPGKKSKLGVLDMEIENGGTGLGLIVLDSIAAVQPPVEEAAQTGAQSMAAMARFLPAELRRLTPLLSGAGVTFIAVNQLREKPGVLWGDPTSSSGGHALKYACSAMVHLNKLNGTDAKIERNDELVGAKIRCRIDKNKLGRPYRTTDFSIEFTKGVINKHEEIRDLAVKYGVITRPNNRIYELDGHKYNGKDEISALFVEEQAQRNMWTRICTAKQTYVEPNKSSESPDAIDE